MRVVVEIVVGMPGVGPGVDVLVAVDVGDAISTPGAITVLQGVHAVIINNTIKQHSCRRLLPTHSSIISF